MPPRTYKFEYAVIGQDGEPGQRFPVESRFPNDVGVINAAAEDFHKRPEAEGLEWPLSFVAFGRNGRCIGPYPVKRWFLPCFLVTGGREERSPHSTPYWERYPTSGPRPEEQS